MEVVKFRIKIIRCSHPKFWYNNLIDKEMFVIDECIRDYYVNNNGNTSYGILKIDAVILK